MAFGKGVCALSALAVVFVASAADAADKKLVAYSAPGLVGAQAQIQTGLVNAGKAKGWDVVTTTSGGDAQKQLNDINDFIAQNVAQPRGAGFDDALKAYPDAQVIRKVGDWDAAKGVEIVRDVASAEADLDAIYHHSDCVYSAGTIQRLKEIGKAFPAPDKKHVFIAGVDGCLATLDLIRAASSTSRPTSPSSISA